MTDKTRPLKSDEIVSAIRESMGDQAVDCIYRQKVIPLRTRRFELRTTPEGSTVEVMHTLLGIELKIGHRRLLCPDPATATYLAVFARIGCEAVAIPYEIRELTQLAEEVESSWQKMMLLMKQMTNGRTKWLKTIVYNKLKLGIRAQITEAGAGEEYPEFIQETRQRKKKWLSHFPKWQK